MMSRAMRFLLIALTLSALGFGCQTDRPRNSSQPGITSTSTSQQATAAPSAVAESPSYGFEIVNTYPHDQGAYTQGLIFHDGYLLESTGQNGRSSLRKVELKTGAVLKKVDVAAQYFAEGMTLFKGKIYQLTWTTHKGFIYDPESFALLGEFYFDGEGWGLTHDNENLILSDGTHQIRFLDPVTFQIKKTINVMDQERPLRDLNELEYVKGEIYANIWQTDRIVRIDPQTGKILGWINLTNLTAPIKYGADGDAVLNGIAYDEANDRLFVTGKLWPKLFEIRVKKL